MLFDIKGWNVNKNVKGSVKRGKRRRGGAMKVESGEKEELKEAEKATLAEKAEKEESQDSEDLEDSEPAQELEESEPSSDNESSSDDESSLQSEAPSKKLTPLQQKMMQKLSGSRFRWINEQLYTTRSENALKLIEDQPELFDAYHQGFRSQVENWPENPVDTFVEEIKLRSKRPINAPGGLPGIVDEARKKTVVIADMGCGEAQFAKDIDGLSNGFKGKSKGRKRAKLGRPINFKVHSFDLKKANKYVTVSDIKNVPLEDESCSIVIFCLALMGTNFLDFINEAYRILAPRGELWIAEIKSRFDNGAAASATNSTFASTKGEEFVNALKLMGFFHKTTDTSNKMFIRFEFFKPPPDIIKERNEKLQRRQKFIEVETEKDKLMEKREKIEEGKWLLKPCIYKRR